MPFDASIKDPKARIAAFLEGASKIFSKNWDDLLIQGLTIISAETTSPTSGKVVYEFTVADWMCNGMNNMHGGCISTMFDDATTFAIAAITRPGFWELGGVSRTLNCTYLRPTPNGSRVRLEAEVVHAGRKLVTLTGALRNEKGEVTALCEHGKVNIDPPRAKV